VTVAVTTDLREQSKMTSCAAFACYKLRLCSKSWFDRVVFIPKHTSFDVRRSHLTCSVEHQWHGLSYSMYRCDRSFTLISFDLILEIISTYSQNTWSMIFMRCPCLVGVYTHASNDLLLLKPSHIIIKFCYEHVLCQNETNIPKICLFLSDWPVKLSFKHDRILLVI
jgi:hypothetical protein